MVITYHVTALQIAIYFNKEGDHDHNGLIFALSKSVRILEYIEAMSKDVAPSDLAALHSAATGPALASNVTLPTTKEEARTHPLMRPLVLRACVGDTVRIELHNEIANRWVGPHLVGPGYDVVTGDGSDVGSNPHSLIEPGGTRTYTWQCEHEGVFPFHDGGNYSGGEDGTNVHGLFGALIVEPPGVIWRDPVTGRTSNDGELDGLYLDVMPAGALPPGGGMATSSTTLEDHVWPKPLPYTDFRCKAHREFVIFFHDEPEFLPPHRAAPENPCPEPGAAGHGGGDGGHGEHALMPIMPVSYRAEPMINREHILWDRICNGKPLKRPVLNEEQHHSSWMFGDPATPILKAYIGDPVRIRFVHAGVKETHVFHLHLYEWHAVSENLSSPRIDAISVSPQTAYTIDPVWGAGNRHQVAGDVIWHCHLYPHFHEGMWGMFRTFETLQTGIPGDPLDTDDPIYSGRRLGHYPDGTPIAPLLPLPDRVPPPRPTATHPGYPLYIPGEVGEKSPIPPWPDRDLQPDEELACSKYVSGLRAADMPKDFDYRATPTYLERLAFNDRPVPAEMFTRNRLAKQQAHQWLQEPKFEWNDGREVCHPVVVAKRQIEYNGHGWHDKDGHLFYFAEGTDPKEPVDDKKPRRYEPLFFRANHGQIVNLILENTLPHKIPRTAFDVQFPPECPGSCRLDWEGECATHVHMVKFDPICGDGASVGWNYISGARFGKKMVYRWWLDQEFGVIFFHDHLFANYRQKHGLFGALLVEPKGAKAYDNVTNKETLTGLQARVQLCEPQNGTMWFREFCIGVADFIPMWDRNNNPLNPPDRPGGHGDQGVMALNYRCEPIPERLHPPGNSGAMVDPALWFTSQSPWNRDPYTTLFRTYENDPIWFRVVQGSHEEQHSFQVHGMRWRRFRAAAGSAVRNQQTFGLSEAFTFVTHEPYGPGDYMYKLSSADDLWLGCWGLIRAFPHGYVRVGDEILPSCDVANSSASPDTAPPVHQMRRFTVVAEPKRLTYREPDLIDPFGLIYRLKSWTPPNGMPQPVPSGEPVEPLILRCRQGEWLQITLENALPSWYHPQPEPFAPVVPVEERNGFSNRPERPVSTSVSMHADLLAYDVRSSDGANVGRNAIQTADKGQTVTYTWHANLPPPMDGVPANNGQPLGPVLLQDMADFRNHRHHGLIGALVVEDAHATPLRVELGQPTALGAAEAWYGSRATVVVEKPGEPEERFEEAVLLMQDGLRLFLHGHIHHPVADEPPGGGETEVDAEDQGQKGFNYRCEPVGPNVDPFYDPNGGIAPGEWPPLSPIGDWLSNPHPATPVFVAPARCRFRLHLVGAFDKPRNQSFTIHGLAWLEERFRPPQPNVERWVSSESALTTGTVHTFDLWPQHEGDHAYRSGVLKWAVPQGLWGILRFSAPFSRSRRMSVEPSAPGILIGVSVGVLLGLLAWQLGRKKTKP